MPDTSTRYYVGPHDALETVLKDGSVHVVERGKSIEVSKFDADRFDEQPENWAKSDPAKSTKSKGE